MIGAISGVSGSYYPVYSVRQAQQQTANTGAAGRPVPEAAAEPASPARPAFQADPTQATFFQQRMPEVRKGADPVEMAVRMRIRYVQPEEAAGIKPSGAPAGGAAAGVKLPTEKAETENPARGTDAALGASDLQKASEEGRCETCEKRRYQDGSDDPGVSFKTPTNIAPEQAASAVRSHEMEHVTREQAKAQREGRRVVSQSVRYHTGICPECGKVYVSGGTTRTVTAADNEDAELQQDTARQNQTRRPFSAVA